MKKDNVEYGESDFAKEKEQYERVTRAWSLILMMGFGALLLIAVAFNLSLY